MAEQYLTKRIGFMSIATNYEALRNNWRVRAHRLRVKYQKEQPKYLEDRDRDVHKAPYSFGERRLFATRIYYRVMASAQKHKVREAEKVARVEMLEKSFTAATSKQAWDWLVSDQRYCEFEKTRLLRLAEKAGNQRKEKIEANLQSIKEAEEQEKIEKEKQKQMAKQKQLEEEIKEEEEKAAKLKEKEKNPRLCAGYFSTREQVLDHFEAQERVISNLKATITVMQRNLDIVHKRNDEKDEEIKELKRQIRELKEPKKE